MFPVNLLLRIYAVALRVRVIWPNLYFGTAGCELIFTCFEEIARNSNYCIYAMGLKGNYDCHWLIPENLSGSKFSGSNIILFSTECIMLENASGENHRPLGQFLLACFF